MKKYLYILPIFSVLVSASICYGTVQFDVLAPSPFIRGKGKPVEEVRTFSSDYGGTATFVVNNGSLMDSLGKRVSSSTITLNGQIIFSSSEFNQNADYLEKGVVLNIGENTLKVLLKGKPGGVITCRAFQTAKSLKTDPESLTLVKLGETFQVTVTGTLSDGTEINLTYPSYETTYSSQNTGVATVSNQGLITAVAEGDSLIEVRNDSYEADISVHVRSDLPAWNQLGSSPDAISILQTANVLFTVMLSGAELKPSQVSLEELDKFGAPTKILGSLSDDGTEVDHQGNDYVYSGAFNLSPLTEGQVSLRVKATFPGISNPVHSGIHRLGVTRFPTETQAPDMTKIVYDMSTGGNIISDEVIVSFAEGTDPDIIENIMSSVGGTVVGTIFGLGYFQVKIPGTGDVNGVYNAITNFQSFSEVRTAEPNMVGSINFAPSDPFFANQWSLLQISAPSAWIVERGTATIAVLDTGVDYTHPDLNDKIIKGKNYFDGSLDPLDDMGHGTAVAGVAAAETNNSTGISGIAWDSAILAVKVCDIAGFCPEANTAQAIKYAADEGVKIINLSVGYPFSTSSLLDAVNYAAARGVLVVAAAGNDLCTNEVYPAAYDNVIAVGATDVSESRAIWNAAAGECSPGAGTNFGNWVNIGAPGDQIYSTMPTYNVTLNGPPRNFSLNYESSISGTSMASPVVAGAASIVWSRHPFWSASMVRNRLEQTAFDVVLIGDLGAGRVNLHEAIFNGGFDIGDLSEWTVNGTASSISQLGPIWTPHINDPRMGFVSNGPSNQHEFSELSQTFPIQPGVTELDISFAYNFLSEDDPSRVPPAEMTDQLVISFGNTDSASGITSWTDLLTIFVRSEKPSMTLVGGLSFSDGGGVFQTGWRYADFSVQVTEGQGTLKISVRDQYDLLYDSVVLIDDIIILPE